MNLVIRHATHMFRYDPQNTFRQSVIHYAIQEIEDEDTILEIVPDAVDCIHAVDIYRLSPLHYAIQYDYVRLAHWLLKNGSNIYQKDIYGDTPFQYAKRYYTQNPCHIEMIRVLSWYERFHRIRFKIRFMGALMCLYRSSAENVYKPLGVGYWNAHKEFNDLLINGRGTTGRDDLHKEPLRC